MEKERRWNGYEQKTSHPKQEEIPCQVVMIESMTVFRIARVVHHAAMSDGRLGNLFGSIGWVSFGFDGRDGWKDLKQKIG